MYRYDQPVEPTYKRQLADMYNTIKNVSASKWIQMMKPGIDGEGVVKELDELEVSLADLKDIDDKIVDTTSKRKMLKVPSDNENNCPSIPQILRTVSVFVSANAGKVCKLWNWTAFCQDLNLSPDPMLINCLKFWIWHCIFKQSAEHVIDISKYLLQESIQKHACWLTGEGTAVHPVQCEVSVQGILNVKTDNNIPEIHIPCLEINLQEIEDAVKNVDLNVTTTNILPSLENDTSKINAGPTAADYKQYGTTSNTSKKQSVKTIFKHTTTFNDMSDSDNVNIVQSSHWLSRIANMQKPKQRSTFDFKSKPIAIIGKWPKVGKNTKQKAKELVTKMNGLIRHQIGKKCALIVLGNETVTRSAQIQQIIDEKLFDKVVKPQYLETQLSKLLRIERTDATNKSLFWTKAELVTFMQHLLMLVMFAYMSFVCIDITQQCLCKRNASRKQSRSVRIPDAAATEPCFKRQRLMTKPSN